MSSKFAIEIKNVSRKFDIYAKPRDRLIQYMSFGRKKYFKEFWAVRNVTLNIKAGETFALLGRNGSGKSTLLQMVAGTLSVTSGSIATHGVLAALLELGSGFNPEFTGRENVYLNGMLLGLSKEVINNKFDEIVSFADIGIYLDQPVKTYSSGMYVRLAFAVQACIEPRILIVDEALAVGDEKFQRKCFSYIEKLRSNGCSILLVSHAISTVEKFCQRAALLHQGEVQSIGNAKEVIDQYHALLYSDEKSYLRYLNSKNRQKQQEEAVPERYMPQEEKKKISETAAEKQNTGCRAMITSYFMTDKNGDDCGLFYHGSLVKIFFFVDVYADIDEIQSGISIRTVEGVTAFGTSTMYSDQNFKHAKAGDRLKFEFDFSVNLCAGTYFVTLAIAEALAKTDMAYLDKKTDIIIIKVLEHSLTASGIAMLPYRFRIAKE